MWVNGPSSIGDAIDDVWNLLLNDTTDEQTILSGRDTISRYASDDSSQIVDVPEWRTIESPRDQQDSNKGTKYSKEKLITKRGDESLSRGNGKPPNDMSVRSERGSSKKDGSQSRGSSDYHKDSSFRSKKDTRKSESFSRISDEYRMVRSGAERKFEKDGASYSNSRATGEYRNVGSISEKGSRKSGSYSKGSSEYQKDMSVSGRSSRKSGSQSRGSEENRKGWFGRERRSRKDEAHDEYQKERQAIDLESPVENNGYQNDRLGGDRVPRIDGENQNDENRDGPPSESVPSIPGTIMVVSEKPPGKRKGHTVGKAYRIKDGISTLQTIEEDGTAKSSKTRRGIPWRKPGKSRKSGRLKEKSLQRHYTDENSGQSNSWDHQERGDTKSRNRRSKQRHRPTHGSTTTSYSAAPYHHQHQQKGDYFNRPALHSQGYDHVVESRDPRNSYSRREYNESVRIARARAHSIRDDEIISRCESKRSISAKSLLGMRR